jgi:hypothetical protein
VAYLLGFLLCVIAVFAAAVGTLIGFSKVSTSERVATQYPPAAVERNVTATHRKPRLFMVVPDTKDASPTNNTEVTSAVAPDEKTEAKTSKPHRHKAIARQRNNYERPSYGNAQGYADAYRNGTQRLWSNW